VVSMGVTVSRKPAPKLADNDQAGAQQQSDSARSQGWVNMLDGVGPKVKDFPPELRAGQAVKIGETSAWLLKNRNLKLTAAPGSPPFVVLYSAVPFPDAPDRLLNQKWEFKPGDKQPYYTFLVLKRGGTVTMLCTGGSNTCVATSASDKKDKK